MVNILDLFTEEELTNFVDTGDGNLRGPCIGGCSNPESGMPYDCLIRTASNDIWCFSCNIAIKNPIDILAIKQGRRTCGDFQ